VVTTTSQIQTCVSIVFACGAAPRSARRRPDRPRAGGPLPNRLGQGSSAASGWFVRGAPGQPASPAPPEMVP
jgi:hypothetical protein